MFNYYDTIVDRYKTFEERFEYLKRSQRVGAETFGFDRYLNQRVYSSSEWKKVRDRVIVRDEGFDLAIPGLVIYKNILVHHICPITKQDIMNGMWEEKIFNEQNLICASFETHQAIHYGCDTPEIEFKERKPNDTKLW